MKRSIRNRALQRLPGDIPGNPLQFAQDAGVIVEGTLSLTNLSLQPIGPGIERLDMLFEQPDTASFPITIDTRREFFQGVSIRQE